MKIDYGDFDYEVDNERVTDVIADILCREFAEKENREIARTLYCNMIVQYELLDNKEFMDNMEDGIRFHFHDEAMDYYKCCQDENKYFNSFNIETKGTYGD